MCSAYVCVVHVRCTYVVRAYVRMMRVCVVCTGACAYSACA